MSTNFLSKRWIYLLFIFVGATLLYAHRLVGAQRVELNKSFYLLASKEEHIEVGAEFARLDGGAGYVWKEEGREHVLLSVYTCASDAKEVQAALSKDGRETELIVKAVDALYFKGREKKKSALYINALRTFDSYIFLLEECVSRLEKGSSQESCKRLLSLLKRQFAYSEKSYKEYGEYAQVCKYSKETLSALCEDTLFVKDLRYLLCWQAEKYLELSSAFSL